MSKRNFIAIWLLIGIAVFLLGMMFQDKWNSLSISGNHDVKLTLSSLKDVDTVSPQVVELTKHFIDRMPEKTQTNSDLLKIYLEAYKQFANAVKFAK